MISITELKERGINHDPTYWRWLPPGYKLKTREFSPINRIQNLSFLEYCILWAERLNKENKTDRYHVGYKSASFREVRFITVVKVRGKI